jgi:opacity protein-like surface antigen
MNRLAAALLAVTLAAAALDAQARQGQGDPRFVGNWRLVSFVNIDEKGATTPSRYTGGRIMYDAAGQMAAQLTHADRPALPQGASDAQRAAAYGGFLSYYGAYVVDERTTKVTHHVEGSTNPNWPNTELVRYFEFADGGHTLKLSIRNAAGRTTGTLTWARIR